VRSGKKHTLDKKKLFFFNKNHQKIWWFHFFVVYLYKEKKTTSLTTKTYTTMKSYVKRIKSALSKDELRAITYDACTNSRITRKQYDKLISYAVCREIELGIWDYLGSYSDKETALKLAQKEFGIKY
jgi:hypothetical protein